MRKLVCIALLIALVTSLIYPLNLNGNAIVRDRRVVVVAVTQLSNGSYLGVSADLYVRITCPGSGHVYVETLPLTQLDLQASTRVAALVASRVAGIDFNSCDYYASVRAESPIIGGPSASGVTAVAFASALLNLPLRNDVVMTGMIMPDGSIGPVGGLKAKLEAAASRGAKVFLVPYGQTKDVDYVVVTERRGSLIIQRTQQIVVDLVDYGRKLGVNVVPVANVYDAINIFTGGAFKAPDVGNASYLIGRISPSLDPVFKSWISNLTSEIDKYVDLGDSIKDRALSTLRGATSTYVRNLIINIETSINTALRNGKELESQGLLYAASSTYFQALIYAKWRYYLLNTILNNTYIDYLIGNINTSAYSVISEVHRLLDSGIDLASLSVVANVLERAYDSVLYLNMSINSQGVDTMAYYLALADARVYTAKLWLGLLNYRLVGTYVRPEHIKDMATYIQSLAYNLYSYIIALSSSTSLPSEVLDEAYSRYSLMSSLNNYLDIFAVGLSALSYMHVTLATTFVSDLNSSIEMLNKTILTSLTLLNESAPIDAIMYMELANTYSSNPQYQLYMLSRLSMLLATYVTLLTSITGGGSTSTPIETQACTPIITVTKTVVTTTCPTIEVSKPMPDLQSLNRVSTTIAIILLMITAVVLTLYRTTPQTKSP